MALHGSWDRSRKTGYKIIFFPWRDGRPGPQIDLVSGWLNDQSQSQWGRPVDAKPANDGSLLDFLMACFGFNRGRIHYMTGT